jgi:hypothetical protein
MKIGIFGDSYAASTGPTSWGSLLATMNNCEVENFAERGSSLFYSYLKFIENYKNVDVMVFLVTAPGRLYHPEQTLANIFSLEYRLKNGPHSSDVEAILQAAIQYFLHLQNSEFDNFVHVALIEKIVKLSKENDKKLIMLPSLGESKNMEIMPYSGGGFFLDRINIEERKHFGVPHEGMQLERTRLQNHITDTNNLIFAKLLSRIINGEELKIYAEDFNYCPDEDPNIYYDMEKMKEL